MKQFCKNVYPNFLKASCVCMFALCMALFLPGCRKSSSGGGAVGPVNHTLSGTIFSMANTDVDSDVNDPDAEYVSNDSFALAQVLPNPVTLSGYVNVAGKGSEGRSFVSGDLDDYFKVELAAAQVISLSIAEGYGNNLSLTLYDSGQSLVDLSLGTAREHTVTATGAGDYYFRVRAVNGASIYTISVGHQALAAGAYSSLRLGSRFVPHEVIVRFEDDPSLPATGASQWNTAHPLGMSLKKGRAGQVMLLGFDDAGRETVFDNLGIGKTEDEEPGLRSSPKEQRWKLDTLRVIDALRGRDDVRYAEPNFIRTGSAAPNDNYYDYQWNLPLIDVPEAWDLTTGSSDVIVAVIDTGVLLSHPDLSGKLLSNGFDFIQDTGSSLDGDGIDNDPTDPGDQSAGGSSFHGTHVAGIIGAATDNNKGVAAIAWTTRILPVRVLGLNASGSTYDIAQGIRYAAGLSNDSGIVLADHADILNLSLGGSDYSQAEADAVSEAINNQGVIVVAAAGNDSTSTPFYPGAHAGVISVSAVDINSEFAGYSNYGSTIDVAAPGGNGYTDYNGDGLVDGILSTCGDDSSGTVKNNYCFQVGSSMACAHVSGVAALMKAVYPAMTPAELDTFLASGWITDDLGDPGRDDLYGYGLINAYRAVLQAKTIAEGGALPTLLGINPASVNLSLSEDSATLTALKWGSGALSITTITPSESWVSVSADSVDGEGMGTYTLVVDRSGLSPGSHSANVTFASSENDVVVEVNAQVTSIDTTSDAGLQYVFLVDYDTQESQTLELTVSNGTYTYSFSDVPDGRYQIYAGTNLDNDDQVGDEGEAFGAYLSSDFPVVITVSGSDITSLDFMTGFSQSLNDSAATSLPGALKNKLD